MANNRDFATPEYKKWRLGVYRRDKYKCKMPGCATKRGRVVAHHIRRWADSPELRYDISNGITLCQACHKMVTGKEQMYADMFMLLLLDDPLAIKRKLREK